MVLGCTHYPLIKENIKNVLGNVKFFDGGKGVAKELKRQIENNNIETKEGYSMEFIDSSSSKQKEQRFFSILTK